jgi:hypothetical protein
MMNSSVLWGLVSGGVFLLVIGFYRFVLPKLVDQSRKLSNEANSLLAPKSAKPALPNEAEPIPSHEGEQPVATRTTNPGAAIPTVRTFSTGILLVAWPIFTFILPFTAFYPPLLFVYVVYPLVWYFSGVFYKTALAEGKRNLLMASAPLLFLLIIGVALLLISALVAALQK